MLQSPELLAACVRVLTRCSMSVPALGCWRRPGGVASSEDGSVVWPSLHIGGHQPGTHHSHQAALPGHTPSTQHEGEYSNTVTSSDSFVNTSDHHTQGRFCLPKNWAKNCQNDLLLPNSQHWSKCADFYTVAMTGQCSLQQWNRNASATIRSSVLIVLLVC